MSSSAFLLLAVSIAVAELVAPCTKVEESFNMQAMHDFIFSSSTRAFDHVQFPGVVPRTFVGAWAVSTATLALLTVVVEPFLGLLITVWQALAAYCCKQHASSVVRLLVKAMATTKDAELLSKQNATAASVTQIVTDSIESGTQSLSTSAASGAEAPCFAGANVQMMHTMPLTFEGLLIQNPMVLSHMCRLMLGASVGASIWWMGTSLDLAAAAADKRSRGRSPRDMSQLGKPFASVLSYAQRHPPSWFFYLALVLQFHVVFYATRPLPNTFGLILVTVAGGCALRGAAASLAGCTGDRLKRTSKGGCPGPRETSSTATSWAGPRLWHGAAVFFLSGAATLFRCDVLVLLAPLGLFFVLTGRLTYTGGVAVGLFGAAVALASSGCMDSFLWQRWLWPEGEVFFFNTVENKSSEWGRSPFFWYWGVALPRGWLLLYPLVLAGLVREVRTSLQLLASVIRRDRNWLVTRDTRKDTCANEPVVALAFASSWFLVLYSFLPHKEVRFVLIVFPWLAAVAAMEARALTSWVCHSVCHRPLNAGPPAGKRPDRDCGVQLVSQKVEPRGSRKNATALLPHQACKWLSLLAFLGLVLQFASVWVSVAISRDSYPGCVAISSIEGEMLRYEQSMSPTSVGGGVSLTKNASNEREAQPAPTLFIDSYAAMTGISRFHKTRHPDHVQLLREVASAHSRARNLSQLPHNGPHWAWTPLRARLLSLLSLPLRSVRCSLRELPTPEWLARSKAVEHAWASSIAVVLQNQLTVLLPSSTGGVYTDCDSMVREPFPGLLPEGDAALFADFQPWNYVKDPTRFLSAEEMTSAGGASGPVAVYRPDGVDFAIARAEHRALHDSHNIFEVIREFPRGGVGRRSREPFLLSLRRKYPA